MSNYDLRCCAIWNTSSSYHCCCYIYLEPTCFIIILLCIYVVGSILFDYLQFSQNPVLHWILTLIVSNQTADRSAKLKYSSYLFKEITLLPISQFKFQRWEEKRKLNLYTTLSSPLIHISQEKLCQWKTENFDPKPS